MADKIVPIKDQKLLDVKLGQLPSWIAARDFTPRGFFLGCQAGYNRFLNKYIRVKRAGIGGFAMMMTGYVILSYMWSYSHLKTERIRKYH